MRAGVFASLVLYAVAFHANATMAASETSANPVVTNEVKHDVSSPLRELKPVPQKKCGHRVIPVRPIPFPSPPNPPQQSSTP